MSILNLNQPAGSNVDVEALRSVPGLNIHDYDEPTFANDIASQIFINKQYKAYIRGTAFYLL